MKEPWQLQRDLEDARAETERDFLRKVAYEGYQEAYARGREDEHEQSLDSAKEAAKQYASPEILAAR